MKIIAIGISTLSIIGCIGERDQPGTFEAVQSGVTIEASTNIPPDEATPLTTVPQSGLSLQITQGDGEFFPPTVVPDKEQVHLRLRGTPTKLDPANANYQFRIVDQAGQLRSIDDDVCRRFHVDARGRIDAIVPGVDANGAACEHRFGIADNGSLTPQLVPFDDTEVDADGTMHYALQVTAVGAPSAALAIAFRVHAPSSDPEP